MTDVTDDVTTARSPEAKQELRHSVAKYDAETIALLEKALRATAARIEELAVVILPAEAKVKATATEASSAEQALQVLVRERDRLKQRQAEDMRELDRKRCELASFCARHGIST
jgi:hypothetical protein